MITKRLYLLLALLAFISSDSEAVVYRLLTGDSTTVNANWSATEGGYSFSVVTNGSPAKPWISGEHFAGSNCIAFQVPTNQSGDTERVEYKILQASDTNGLHFDNARYTGFAFKLASNAAPFTSSCIFWQAWQGSPWGPPAMLKFAADSSPPYRIRLTIRNMTTGPDSAVPDMELWAGSIIQPDTWYSVVICVAPRLDTNGNIKLWINGTNLLNWTGQFGYDPAQVAGALNGLDIKCGVYQPDANNGHTLYFDQIKIADTYVDASPTPYTNTAVLSDLAPINGLWSFLLNGSTGASYTIEASSCLTNWLGLMTTNPSAMPFRFTDTATNHLQRFYRATAEP